MINKIKVKLYTMDKYTRSEYIKAYDDLIEEEIRESKRRIQQLVEMRKDGLKKRFNQLNFFTCSRCRTELLSDENLKEMEIFQIDKNREVHVFVCSNCGKIHIVEPTDIGTYVTYTGSSSKVPSYKSFRHREIPIKTEYMDRINIIE